MDRAKRLAELFEQAPGFLCVQRGPEHVYEVANAAYRRLVGGRDLIGRTVLEALPELKGQPYFDLLNRAYRTGIPHTERGARVLLMRSPNRVPEEVFVDLVYQPILDASGAVTGIFTQGVETSDRVRAEAALRDHEERLRLATEAADVGFWDVDPIDDVLVWPARVKAMFGISPDAPVSMAGDFYACLHPEDREKTGAAFAAACDPARRALYDVEYRTVGKEDGIIRWVAAKGRGVFDEDGRCIRVIGTAIDITARKRVEAELRSLNELLEARVAAEIAAREEAQARLAHAQRMEALGQLAGGIAHDFNNVLQAVIGGVSLIDRRAENPESVRSLARMAADAAGRGTAITARLLAFARRGELRPGAIEPEPLLEGLREMLEPTLGAGVSVRIETSPRTPMLLADKAQLETVLVNLAINARDAMLAGGTLTLSARPLEVREPVAHAVGLAPGTYVRLDVTDTGTGMDKATLARASEPFFTTKPAGQGTGLGLAMARGFAEQSGGGFEIASAPGQGTTVTLWLPKAADRGEEQPAGTGKDGSAEVRGARTMVVDDDEMVRTVLVGQIEQLGYAVVESSDGLAALARLDAGYRPDLLLTDFSMPGMNGLMLIDEARRRFPGLPAVLLTGFADSRLREIERLGDERTRVVRKPVTESALGEHLAQLLRARPADAAGRSSGAQVQA